MTDHGRLPVASASRKRRGIAADLDPPTRCAVVELLIVAEADRVKMPELE